MVIPGQHQPTVSGWIISTETPRRAVLAYHRKLKSWLQPGGHVEPTEDYWQAMVREVKEETGIDLSDVVGREKLNSQTWEVRPPDFLQVQTIPAHGDQPAHFHVDSQYVVEVPYQELQRQDLESEDIGWFGLADLAELDLFPNTRSRLEKLLQTPEERS